ncbi:MAG TPA: fibronectin type III domain-containing protein [Vicinamibacterales bacterium]|nr:fibronectin type III domain-containing protein [Vicinamibacterales bacterium]
MSAARQPIRLAVRHARGHSRGAGSPLHGRAFATAVALGLIAGQVSGIGCGKKGPPLAPLRLVPAPVSAPDARRSGASVELRFGLPTANANGPGPVELDRVEIYALTIAAGANEPANQVLLTRDRLIGTLAVRPVQESDEVAAQPAQAPADTRPAPGDRVTFVEELTGEKLVPVKGIGDPATAGAGGPEVAAAGTPAPGAAPTSPAPETPPPGGTGAQPAAAAPAAAEPSASPPPAGQAVAPAPGDPDAPQAGPPATPGAAAGSPAAGPKVPYRVYGMRGMTRGGRPGPPVRVKVPLVDPPAAPAGVAARFTEHAIALDWTPPVAEVGAAPIVFNVYPAAGGAGALNAAPLTAPAFEQPIAGYGEERCFVVRSAQVVAGVSIESESSPPACTTPQDIFPPAAPGGLQAVPTQEGVSLSWDVSAAPDLAGYVLLRGEAPGATLQPLTPEPIRETTFRDTTVQPGVTYVYALVAVDRASPPNTSARSEPVTVTAR